MNNETSGPAVASIVPCINYRVINKIRITRNWCPLVVELASTKLWKKLRVALKFGVC